MSAFWKGTNMCLNLVKKSCSFLLPRLLKGSKYIEVLEIFVCFPQSSLSLGSRDTKEEM